jgi:hypothetical protein
LTQKVYISKENLSIIEKDVRRTRNCLNNPRKMKFIRNVLQAFVKRNPEIGYLQGFNFMVEFFWTRGFDEESAFWMFCHLNENLVLINFFRNLTPLFADVKMFKYFLYYKNKKLFRSVMQNKIDLFFIVHKYFLVNFMNVDNPRVGVTSCRPGSSTSSSSTSLWPS